jgi:hypothetical protein
MIISGISRHTGRRNGGLDVEYDRATRRKKESRRKEEQDAVGRVY